MQVTTTTGVVAGVLQDSPEPEWIRLVEPGRSSFTAVRLGSVSVVQQAAGQGVSGAASPRLRLGLSVPAGPGAAVRRDSLSLRPTVRPPAAATAPGAVAPPVPGAVAPPAPSAARAEPSAAEETFQLPFVFGMPRPIDGRHSFTPPGQPGPVAGITVLERHGVTVGHYDRFKVPAWVAMRWTEEDLELSERPFDRPPFRSDTELPPFARAGTNYEFATSRFQRGHMARDQDLGAWGQLGVVDGAKMSNIVPQREGRNHVVWGRSEDEHRQVVGRPLPGVETVWIVSGPVFRGNVPLRTVGNEVGVPHATYKVLAWVTRDGDFRMRGIMIDQDDTDDGNLEQYLVPVDEVEAATGLDFFHTLPDADEDALEAVQPRRLWFDD